MAAPPYKLFIEPVLRYLALHDSTVATGAVCEAAARVLQLSDDDRAEQLPSGGPVYKNRASWALNWLKRAGLAQAPNQGEWQLTVSGKQLAAEHLVLTRELLSTFAAKVEERSLSLGPSRAGPTLESAPITPTGVGNRKAYRLPPRPLAVGGQAEVYEAVRKADNKTLVLKRVREALGQNRMRREIEVQSSLRHANIMPILDWDSLNYTWYVMPRGRRVMSELTRPVEPDLLCRIVKSVAAALEVAHAAGHPHRDVKPQNIIELDGAHGEGQWVLADWGLTRRAPGATTAEWTKTGQFLGSAGFAPPEAYQDAHNVGAPGDVYALGQVIAWATGVDPVPNVSPTVMAPWQQVVGPMTQQEARKRPQTMAEVQCLLSIIFDRDDAKGC
ncbi:protein kinase domain-containing protein [Sorangium sp. So ce145]|uniref:protein kinase domain-containing protein n=1 Tax=Sorangium sp. So ce145 TaxID=3133285 RepID=UPI003F5E2DF5